MHGGNSRGHGSLVRRVRGWVAGSASSQRGDVEGGQPRVSQRRAHSPQKVRKNSGDGETRLGWMVGTAAMKTTAGCRTSPEDHHCGPRPRLRGRCKGSPLWMMMYKQHDCPSRNDYISHRYKELLYTMSDEYHVYNTRNNRAST